MMRLQKRCDMVSPVLAVAVASALLSACVEPTQAIDERRIPIEIGSAAVTVVIHKADEGGLTFVNLHDDENTAVEATLDVLQTDGGRLIELQHTGERNVSFSLDGTEYAFDPNRMFTDGGIDSTLARNGASSQAAHAAVETFADSVLSLIDLDQLPTVVTVHNNSEE